MDIGDRVKVLIDDTEKLDSVDLNQMDFSNGVFGTVTGVSTYHYENAPEHEVVYSVEMDNVSDLGISRWDILESCLEVINQEPTKQASTILQRIQTFTMNHKNLEISFEDGKMILRDWDVRLSEPTDYHCDTIEQLEELMGAWEKLCKFKKEF